MLTRCGILMPRCQPYNLPRDFFFVTVYIPPDANSKNIAGDVDETDFRTCPHPHQRNILDHVYRRIPPSRILTVAYPTIYLCFFCLHIQMTTGSLATTRICTILQWLSTLTFTGAIVSWLETLQTGMVHARHRTGGLWLIKTRTRTSLVPSTEHQWDCLSEMSAQDPKTNKRQHPPQPQSVQSSPSGKR